MSRDVWRLAARDRGGKNAMTLSIKPLHAVAADQPGLGSRPAVQPRKQDVARGSATPPFQRVQRRQEHDTHQGEEPGQLPARHETSSCVDMKFGNCSDLSGVDRAKPFYGGLGWRWMRLSPPVRTGVIRSSHRRLRASVSGKTSPQAGPGSARGRLPDRFRPSRPPQTRWLARGVQGRRDFPWRRHVHAAGRALIVGRLRGERPDQEHGSFTARRSPRKDRTARLAVPGVTARIDGRVDRSDTTL